MIAEIESQGRGVRRFLAPLLLFAGFSLLYAVLSSRLHAVGIYTYCSMLFESDTPIFSYNTLSFHASLPRHAALHPTQKILLAPLNWMIGLIDPYGESGLLPPAAIIVAASGAAAVSILYSILRACSLRSALAWSLLYGFSISTLIFSTLPDSFIISAVGHLLCVYLLLGCRNDSMEQRVLTRPTPRTLLTGIVSGLVSGLTITNALSLGIIGVVMHGRRIRRSVCFLAVMGLTLLAGSLAQHAIFDRNTGGTVLNVGQEFNQSERGFLRGPLSLMTIARFIPSALPDMIVQSMVGGDLYDRLTGLPAAEMVAHQPDREAWCLTFIFPKSIWQSWSGKLSLLLWGGLLCAATFQCGLLCLFFPGLTLAVHRASVSYARLLKLLTLSLLVLAFNLFLHSIYGEDRFLYSAHWVWAVVLAVAILSSLSRQRALITGLTWTTVAWLICHNISVYLTLCRDLGQP